MRVDRKAFILSMMYATIVAICSIFAFMPYGDEHSKLCQLGVIVLVELITFITINARINGRALNYATVFCSVLYIFNFGQLLIYTFFRSIYPHVRFILLMDGKDAIHGFQWMSLAFSMICLGVLTFGMKINYPIANSEGIVDNQIDYVSLSKKIIGITFPVKLVVDVLCLAVSIVGGNARRWMSDVPYVIVAFGKISLIGFALLLLALDEKPKSQKRVFMFICSYILIMMISGIRSENVGYLLIFIFLYFASQNRKIHIPSLAFYAICGFLLLSFIITVGKFRGAEKSLSSLFSIFMDNITKNNVIFSLIDTCGDTGYTTLEVINKWLPVHGATHGDSYYIGWISVIPNIPGIFTLPGDLTAKTCFALRLQSSGLLNPGYYNIGGSLLGELFFNFGLFGGVLASLIIGIIIGWVSKKTTQYIAIKNIHGMIVPISIMFATIYWVRSYFGGEFRIVVWAPFLIYCITQLSAKNKQISVRR